MAELAAVRSFDAASARDALAPFVTALPPETKLNVNTAPPEVLAAAIPGLDGAGVASARRAARGEKPFINIADLHSRLPAGATLDAERLVLARAATISWSRSSHARAPRWRRRGRC